MATGNRVKIVWWDGSWVCLFVKRLEKSSFCWPRNGPARVQLNHAQLMALLDGQDWKRVRPVSVICKRCSDPAGR